MWARPDPLSASFESDLADQLHERLVERGLGQPLSPRVEEERRRRRARPVVVAQPCVLAQLAGRRGVQWHFALFALLGSANVQSTVAQVNVGAVKPERLARPQRARGHQPDHCLHARGAQPRRQASRGSEQRSDVLLAVEVWRDPRPAGGQQVLGRNLAVRVDRRHVPSEPADHPEPLPPPMRVSVDRELGEHHRQLGRDVRDARALQERDVLLEQVLGVLELEPELAADGQVVVQRSAQVGHDRSSGQGSASGLSVLRSTFA